MVRILTAAICLTALVGCSGTSHEDRFVSCGEEVRRLDDPDPLRRELAQKRLEGCPAAVAVPPLVAHLAKVDNNGDAFGIANTLRWFPEGSATEALAGG